MERVTRLELATFSLGSWHSTNWVKRAWMLNNSISAIYPCQTSAASLSANCALHNITFSRIMCNKSRHFLHQKLISEFLCNNQTNNCTKWDITDLCANFKFKNCTKMLFEKKGSRIGAQICQAPLTAPWWCANRCRIWSDHRTSRGVNLPLPIRSWSHREPRTAARRN